MRNKKIQIILLGLLGTLIMIYVDGIVQPHYFMKSFIKIITFSGCIFLYKEMSVLSLFKIKREDLKKAVILSMIVFLLIVGGYFIIRNWIDFNQIAASLENNVGVKKENFIFVALYITLMNSLLEEIFFRGFLFQELYKDSKKFAYLFSSFCFGFYHAGIMLGWFQIWLYLAALTGLMLTGIFFAYLNELKQSIVPSWMVHMSANFAINFITIILYGIL